MMANAQLANRAPCFCGHSKRNHLQGEGLCLVRSCRLCLIYRPNERKETNR